MNNEGILLLYMPSARQELVYLPPLGISSIAGYLRNHNITTFIDDLEIKCWNKDIIKTGVFKWFMKYIPLHYNNPKKVFLRIGKVMNYLNYDAYEQDIMKNLENWEELIRTYLGKINYIGFSVMSLSHLSVCLCFAKYIKDKNKIKIILGGGYITKKMVVLLEKFSFIDYIVVGEGEKPLVQLLSGEEKGRIANLIYRENNGVRINDIRDDYPEPVAPDFDGFPLDLYKSRSPLILQYETSKGCRNKCSFCILRRKKLYIKDVGTVIDEIEGLKERYGTRCFRFADNGINVNREFAVELCKKLIERKIDIVWSAYFIPENEDEAYFKMLWDAGCIFLRWGIETADTNTLKRMNKPNDIKNISYAIKQAHEAGIWNHFIFMIGHPDGGAASLIKTMRFIKKNKKYFRSSNINIFQPSFVDMSNGLKNTLYEELCLNNTYIKRQTFYYDYWTTDNRNSWLLTQLRVLELHLKFNRIKIGSNFYKNKAYVDNNYYYDLFAKNAS